MDVEINPVRTLECNVEVNFLSLFFTLSKEFLSSSLVNKSME